MKMRPALLLLVLPLLAYDVVAAPMADQRYAQDVMHEVEYQNFTCLQLDELQDFLEELRTCGPPGAEADETDTTSGTSNRPTAGMDFADTLRLQSEPKRLCVSDCSIAATATRAIANGRVTVTQADPAKVCRRVAFPLSPLTHEIFDSLGPTGRQAMASIGVSRNMDVIGEQQIGRSPMPMVGARAIIGSVQRPIYAALQLKNCQR